MKNRFGREIAFTLVLKTLALALLWAAFFRHPADEKPAADKVGAALFGADRHQSVPAATSGHGPRPPVDPSR